MNPLDTWSLDREIVLTRVFDAPRDLVWTAWTTPAHLAEWFSPAGYTTTQHECAVQVGARWRFDMHGPAGERYPNRIVFLEIAAKDRIVFDHGDDVDDDGGRFRVTITFDEQSDGKTVLSLRQLHPTAKQRKAGIGFGAVEIGYTTLDNLGAFLKRSSTEAR
jgi:uncharacterized protein YndB with AHSA1/START domain